MDLKTYIETNSVKLSEFAANLSARHGLKISRDQVYQWVNDIRPIPIEYGLPIETETGAAVTRQEMFPEKWRHVWPELIPIKQPRRRAVAV